MAPRCQLAMTFYWPVFLWFCTLGCDAVPAAAPAPPDPAPVLGSAFDPNTTGTILGQVNWTGPLPSVSPFSILPLARGSGILKAKAIWPNPNAPLIDSLGRGVGNAVVFLRGVDPRRSRPWNHDPVQVEMRHFQFCISQGSGGQRYGFVRTGDPVVLVSREEVLHMVHADGAAFFTLAFPQADQSLTRRLPSNGIVELTSASAYFWMRAYLFVDEHPYYTCTDADGRFVLTDVPPGDYELVCWMPNWHEARRDLDPELGMTLRLAFRPPVQARRRVTVGRCVTCEVHFQLSADLFSSGTGI